MGIKVISLIIVFLLAGSVLASAEVDDKSPTEERNTLDSSFSANGASLVDISTGSYGSGSNAADSYTSSEDSLFTRGCGNNKIWILDPDCSKRGLDLSLPFGRWSVLELAPDTSGYAMLFHRLPSGDLQTEYMGYVHSGHRYRLSLCADSTGTHEMWYRIGWQESNRVTLDVWQGNRPY
ncbi:Uncharacterised protein [uncultured archaeon]|nr:Uncharacterised protein [uncultured archaeon]